MTQPTPPANAVRRAVTLVCAALLSIIPVVPAAAAPAPPPGATPVTDHCPHKVGTPPAVDTSEAVAPGESVPPPLPVHSPPVGGESLGGCGVVADPAAGPVPSRLTSAAWLVADMDTGRVIAAKDPHGRYRPASTIKVLLAEIALAELRLDDPVVPTADDWTAESDSCGMGPGGRYTVRDMLTGLLVVSGNDCAHALARQLGGVEETVDKMNARARALQAFDTRAATPSGLDAPGMSTSPYDLALLFRSAMQDPEFRRIIALPRYRFPGYPRRADVPGDTDHPAYDMQTSNQLLLTGYPGMLGGKTGYTDDALKTFVGAARRDGRTVLIVQMYGLSTTDDNYWSQAESLFDYGFRAASGIEVGRLAGAGTGSSATGGAGSAMTTGPRAATPGDANRSDVRIGAPGDTDRTTSWSIRIVIGLVAALVAVLLLAAALRLAAKR
ncbi:D-alanyl-D-alanine carboxypeptidase family protein [Gordonia sinesedis]